LETCLADKLVLPSLQAQHGASWQYAEPAMGSSGMPSFGAKN